MKVLTDRTREHTRWQQWLLIGIASLVLAACSDDGSELLAADGHGAESAVAVEKGANNGRMLHDKNVSVELAIFETGVPPEFRAWVFVDGKPIAPKDVHLQVRLVRLGDKTDVINFAAQGNFLRGDSVIYEPHSFIVHITATVNGTKHHWKYDSLEGRTRIEPAVATALEIATEIAGPASLEETTEVYGKVVATPLREREVQARFNGVITAVHAALGEPVKAGEALVTVESNESLRTYVVNAPISGVVANLNAKVGQQTQGQTLVRIVDNTEVAADLAIFPEQLALVKPGAQVTLIYRDQEIATTIDHLAVETNSNQSINARVTLDQPLPLGALISARIEVAEYEVPLAVKRTGLQAFRDFTVVYAQVGDEYEVRMLELGREAGEWVEILGGLEPGTRYVTENSFVIKADIEKSGASHDH
ncbi:HlyD family efflux transporter periplasmic adaptor subunit [Cellvibrio sp.]